MVQRKVANKLGIQDDHFQPEKLLPSSSQNQEIKNKGADLKKKKMKKSGSFKKPDFEHLHLSRKPGKPPPLVLPTPTSTPIKTMIENTPNYMKSTTSSAARKERVQVSSQSPQTSPDSERSSRRNSKNNSDSGNKPTRTLVRTSSLKLVRTLTKAPSFKPARASVKRISPINIQKATCSSTMKGRKFPTYLTLSPGATEAKGTSVLKVCSYSYCSLNGHHHHEPLPPLKSFLSAKRRMVKAQRSLKLGCLSPRRGKPVRDIMKEIEAAQENGDETPPSEESASFFVEIYSKEREETFRNNQNTTDSSVTDVKPSIVGNETKIESEQTEKSSSHKQQALEIDTLESLLQSRDVTFRDMDADDYLAQGKTKPAFLNLMYELEAGRTPSIQSEEADLETSDMDWETGLYSASYTPYEGIAHPILINHVIDLEKANSALDDALLDEIIFKSEESSGDNCEKNLPDEIVQESMDDETEEDDDKDRSDTLVETLTAIDSAPMEKAIKEQTFTSEDKLRSEPEYVTSNIDPEVSNGMDNIIKTQHVEFESSDIIMSWNMIENLKNSIGTQTDSDVEEFHDMSDNLDEVFKRSIGTQTYIEDDECDALSEMIAEKEKENIDVSITLSGTENLVVQSSEEATEDPSTMVHQVQDCSSAIQSISSCDDLDNSENEIDEVAETDESIITLEDQPSDIIAPVFTGNADQNLHKTQVDSAKDASSPRIKVELVGSNLNEELTICSIQKGTNKNIVEHQLSTEFNPREPNFLPMQPDPEAEKVDLRHLTLDEGKNADEWKLDHAIQQAVTKLAPARKRKVALLVEAFETVLPIPKYETHLRRTSSAFSHVRPMQACS